MGLSSVNGLLTFVLLGALATVGALAWLLKESRSLGPLEADKVVMIVHEDDGGSIADQLESAGVIESAIWFNCTAPGSLDKRLAYAARLKGWPCQAARASSGLWWPFFSISHSAL
jgi:hypothetical protein